LRFKIHIGEKLKRDFKKGAIQDLQQGLALSALFIRQSSVLSVHRLWGWRQGMQVTADSRLRSTQASETSTPKFQMLCFSLPVITIFILMHVY
jgi:hypothetical protein